MHVYFEKCVRGPHRKETNLKPMMLVEPPREKRRNQLVTAKHDDTTTKQDNAMAKQNDAMSSETKRRNDATGGRPRRNWMTLRRNRTSSPRNRMTLRRNGETSWCYDKTGRRSDKAGRRNGETGQGYVRRKRTTCKRGLKMITPRRNNATLRGHMQNDITPQQNWTRSQHQKKTTTQWHARHAGET